MKRGILNFIATMALGSMTHAGTFQLTSNLDNSFFKTAGSGTPGQPGYVAPVFSTTGKLLLSGC